MALATLLGCALIACEPKAERAHEARRAEVVGAGAGPVMPIVAEALARAARDERRLVVYVGASWCEPCEHFLSAVREHRLPAELGDLRFLKFDNDVDEERLRADGFGGQMIPRFVIPLPTGRGSDRRIEGSIKGDGAVGNIVPRLQAILDETS